MKILVLGAGFVGKPLAEYLGADLSTKRLADIEESDFKPYDVVINTIAKTDIDWCEENKRETFEVNVRGAIKIAALARITDTKHVFFSSACIFKSETEDDLNYEYSTPNPQCFYTYTKLMAEQLIMENLPDGIIIRPRLLISEKSNPRNTIDKLLKYDKVITTQESATILEDLLVKVKELIEANEEGPFNVFNEGTISPSEIMDIFGVSHIQITKEELDQLTLGRASRVSTVLGSNRTEPMENIKDRIRQIKNSWIIDK